MCRGSERRLIHFYCYCCCCCRFWHDLQPRQRRSLSKRKDSLILAKVVLKVPSLSVCPCKQILQVLRWVRQELQLYWSSLAAWFPARVSQRWCLLPFIDLVQVVKVRAPFVHTSKVQRTKARKLRYISSRNSLRRFYSRYSSRLTGLPSCSSCSARCLHRDAATLSLHACQVR